jgi:pimeloyl-ACP methyl ester carboxylesterase
MLLACTSPDCVKSLTVIDIAPRAYPARWQAEFAAMQRLPVERLRSRAEAEQLLESDISDWAFRKFLVTNLERIEGGGFRWIINLDTLNSNLGGLFRQIPEIGMSYDGPTLFATGSRSRFVDSSDHAHIRSFFSDCQIEEIQDAGHNVHFDQPAALMNLLEQHLIRT